MEKDILEKLRAFVVETEQDADASDFAVVMATVCEAAADEIDSLRKWVNDLQSGMYVNCVYCGHRYGPEDQVATSMADALKQHIEQCPKHPMSQLRKELASEQEGNARLKERLRSPYGDDRTVDDEHFAIVEAHCTEIYAHNEYLATPIRRGTECVSQAELNALREKQQLEPRKQPITPIGPGHEGKN